MVGLDGWLCGGVGFLSRVGRGYDNGALIGPLDLGWLVVPLFWLFRLVVAGLFIDLINRVWKGYVGGVPYGCVLCGSGAVSFGIAGCMVVRGFGLGLVWRDRALVWLWAWLRLG
jgi:hypothetical protein